MAWAHLTRCILEEFAEVQNWDARLDELERYLSERQARVRERGALRVRSPEVLRSASARWYERLAADEVRAAERKAKNRAAYEKRKADPERYEAELAKQRERVRARREAARAAKG